MISIIMPTYNCSQYIEEAIKSIIIQPPEWELHITDDASTDNTLSLIERYACTFSDIHIHKHKINRGPAAAMNTSLNHAKGEYIAFLDCDDYYLPDRFQAQLKYLQQHPEIWLVSNDWYVKDEIKNSKPSYYRSNIQKPAKHAILLRRAIFDKIEIFDESLRHQCERDFLLRILLSNLPIAKLDIATSVFRWHKGQYSEDREGVLRDILTISKKLNIPPDATHFQYLESKGVKNE